MQQNPQDLVTFTEEILNGKLHFCAGYYGAFLLEYYLTIFANFLRHRLLTMS